MNQYLGWLLAGVALLVFYLWGQVGFGTMLLILVVFCLVPAAVVAGIIAGLRAILRRAGYL